MPQKSKNIKHNGYKILALAYINQCRSKAYKYLERAKGKSPRNFSRVNIGKQWKELIKQAYQISNVSDKVLVLSELAVLSYSYYSTSGKSQCEELLNGAELLINEIPTLLDRASRLEHIGDCWHELENNGKAKFVYRQVADLAQQLRGGDADERLRSLIQSAHLIDDEFADELLSKLDTSRLPIGVIQSAKIKLQIEKTISKPSQFSIKGNKRQREQALHEAYSAWLSSLIVHKRAPLDLNKLIEQFKESLDYSPILIYQVMEWCIENIHYGNLGGLVDAKKFIHLAEIVDKISRFATDNTDNIVKMLQDSNTVVEEKIVVFGVGEFKQARQFILNWIRENSKENIIFCDPYFGFSELFYLQYVPNACPITIITTEKGLDPSKGTEQIKEALIRHWNEITDQELPVITVFIYPILSGEKFHDRAILSSNRAISIGQSLNGLGKSRGIFTLLCDDDVKELEFKYINPLLHITKLQREHRPLVFEI